jgi:4-amino-4-deoxy-L-arabinose transferase-like glycosyltransferase
MTARSQGFLVAALAACVLLPNLGTPPLWDDDEPRNAACSLAMYATGDWLVPTFNGRLRVEKPPLVNWLHIAGFAVAGVNETGARLGSALLTLGTCLLVWRIATALFRPAAGCWAGIAMATCLWTGVGGRAATPDPPLLFCSTLALWLFVRGGRTAGADGTGWRHGPVALSAAAAATIGVACGAALLAKGPVGVVPTVTALVLFAWWQAWLDPARSGSRLTRVWTALGASVRGVRPLFIVAVAVAVAAPWYVAVGIRTDGEWLRRFFLVHNVGRFAAPMEGHSGSPFLYYPGVLLVGMFPWSVAAALIVHHALRAARTAEAGVGVRLLAAWVAAWVIPLSLAATKLPGYVWPVYPALAALTGLFFADWIRFPAAITDRWMRLAWALLAATGIGLAVGLPLAARRYAPGAEWLGLIGLAPLAGAATAWLCQSLRSRIAASGMLAATACTTVGLLLAVAPTAMARAGNTRHLISRLPAAGAGGAVPVASYRAPPSTAFYGGRLAADGRIADLREPAEVAAFVAAHPGAHLIVDARFEEQVGQALPQHYRVLHTTTTLPESRRLLLMGPAAGASGRLAAETAPRLR